MHAWLQLLETKQLCMKSRQRILFDKGRLSINLNYLAYDIWQFLLVLKVLFKI